MNDGLLWYASRGAGFVSLLLLTGVVCLGILTVVRWQRPGWPRFLTAALHGNLALLSVVFLAIHVVAAVLDPFTSLGWGAALIPFGASYRPLWLGIGVIALYLIGAIIVTSLLRAHLGHRAWRSVHWLSYGAWPLAVLHGWGAGTDSLTPWALALDALSVGAVVASLVWRRRALRAARAEVAQALPARPAVPPARGG